MKGVLSLAGPVSDLGTKTEFVERVDARNGATIGIAVVDDAVADHYSARPGFRVLTADEYNQVVGRVAQVVAAAPAPIVLQPVVEPGEAYHP